jgi:uncharacterized membrane protein
MLKKYGMACAPLLVAGTLAGVAGSAAAADLRGFASAGPFGVMLFQPCEGKKVSVRALKVEDATPDGALTAGVDAVRKIMLDSGRPLYVEFRGDVAGLAVTARQFRRALGTVESCGANAVTPGTRLLAGGDEPPWRFVLSASGAQLERPGLKPVRFPAAAFAQPHKTGAGRVFDAWSPQDGGTIRLEIVEQMCSDGRSESAYGARATLRYGSQSFEGCAALY